MNQFPSITNKSIEQMVDQAIAIGPASEVSAEVEREFEQQLPGRSRKAKLYSNVQKDGSLAPIRRAQPKRPPGMTGRQWKKFRKGNRGL